MTGIFSAKRYILKALVIVFLISMAISAIPPMQASSQAGSPEDLIRDDMMLIAERYATHLWTASDVGPEGNEDGNIRHDSEKIETPDLQYCQENNYYEEGCWQIGSNIGVPYAWFGATPLDDPDLGLYELTEGNLYPPPYYFDEKILALKAAGNIDTVGPNPQPPDQAGVDCVGFINNVWRLGTRAGTSITNQETLPIQLQHLKRGDILMKYGKVNDQDNTGNHVLLFKEFVFDEPDVTKIKVYESSASYRKVTESIWKVIGDPVPYVDSRYPDSPTHIVKLERVKVNLDGEWVDSHYFVQDGYVPRTVFQPRDIVIVIDRSGSMSQENRFEQAKESAKRLIDSMRPGDRIGVVAFAGTSTQIYPPPGEDLSYGEIEQNAYNYVKTDAKNAVTNISLGSDGTTIGGGLRLGQQLLDTSDGENRAQLMILLSDGEEISYPFWDDVKPGGSVQPNITVPVHTISIGYTYPLMSEIATLTHGVYWGYLSGRLVSFIIPPIVAATYQERIIEEVKKSRVSSGGTTEETVLVDSTIGSVTFSLAWPGSDLDLTLVQPDGTVINPTVAESDPNIEFVSGATYEYYKILYPQRGGWVVRIYGASTSGPEEEFYMAASAADAMILQVETDKQEYIVGDHIKITATIEDSILDTPLEPEYIHGAVMQVMVMNPLDAQSSFELYDDGLHGDGGEDDGIYANTFSDPLIEGNYSFDLKITGNTIRDGQAFTREKPLAIQVIDPPVVANVLRASASPTNYYNVDYTVIFSESVTGVDVNDFVLTTSGITGAAIDTISGSGSIYTVTVNTGSGNGTIRLDVVDNDTIKDVSSNRLGGVGIGDGNFTVGEVYTIDKTAISTIVTKPEDTNDGLCDADCSLREAIATTAPSTAIAFDASLSGETIHLVSTLTLSKNITLNGSTLAVPITISGDTNNDGIGDVRVFNIDFGVIAVFDNLTVSKGYVSDSGGGIRNLGGTVYIHNSTISGNTAFYGGGMYSTGQVIVNGSTIWGNSASVEGGGIYMNGDRLTVTNSTLSGNSSSARGGGISQLTGTLTITNSTMSGNSASIEGGGVFISNGFLNYANTIIVNSISGGDCVILNGSLGTNSRNLVGDGSCSAELAGNPYLGPLANNGGATQTMALLNGSPAIDAGNDSNCASVYIDQRGVTRPQGLHCDIGAFEVVQVVINADIVTGGYHSCYLSSLGGVFCWGKNIEGQIGDGTTINRTTPVNVTGLSDNVVAITAGESHTCALTTSGGVKCWGDNSSGQLGDGTSTFYRTSPVNVNGLSSGVIAITTGGEHSCALTSDGGVRCWGENSSGQLGDGTTTERTSPVEVSGLTSNVVAITAGEEFTCALTTSGGVKCWGDNSRGQLGDGTTTQSLIPVDVIGLTSEISMISAGNRDHACAVTTNGGAKCWGSNSWGKLGTGTTNDQTTPVNVSSLTSGVAIIDAGASHTCAITTAGGAKCWGFNMSGQLGDGTYTYRITPVDVVGLTTEVANISAGGSTWSHTCALTTSGEVMCWGHNSSGQLGNGTTSKSNAPVSVPF